MALTYRHIVKKANGDTAVAGGRIRVYTLFMNHQSGDSPEELASDYDLALGAVYEALAYAADHPEEMEAIRKANEEAGREVLAQALEKIEQMKKLRRGTDLP